MPMQLLTPSEAQKRSRSDDVLKSVRAKELSDVVNEKRIEIARMEEAGAKFLASQRARWAIEEQEHAEWSAQKKKEVEILEERQRKALFPIEERERNAENKMREAVAAFAKAEEIGRHNDELTEALETRLDSLSERELKAARRDAELDRREDGIEAQEEYTSKRAEEVSFLAQSLFDKAKEAEVALSEREQAVEIRENAIKSVKTRQDTRESEQNYREANLISRYLALEEATRITNHVKPNNISPPRRK